MSQNNQIVPHQQANSEVKNSPNSEIVIQNFTVNGKMELEPFMNRILQNVGQLGVYCRNNMESTAIRLTG